MGIKGDLVLLERAVRRRWNIDLEKTAEIVNELLNSPDERIKARAASIAVQMEKQNQDDEHKIIDVRIAKRNAELDAIAADLGIEVTAIEDATRKSESGDHPTAEHAD